MAAIFINPRRLICFLLVIINLYFVNNLPLTDVEDVGDSEEKY